MWRFLKLVRATPFLLVMIGLPVIVYAQSESSILTLDGKTVRGQIKANGFLGLFETRETLIF